MDFCTCKKEEPAALTLGIATVPLQPWETMVEPAKALCQGTVFPSLSLPFYVTEQAKGGGMLG